MNISPKFVQDIVDQIEEEYRERTLLTENLVRTPNRQFSIEECSETLEVYVEDAENTLNLIDFSNIIYNIQYCERQTLLNGFEAESEQSEDIGENFITDLLKAIGKTSLPEQLYLPDKPEFRMVMEQYDCEKVISTQYDVPVRWFQPDVFDNDKGFLLDNGVYVNQKLQGDMPVVASNLDPELAEDNSENRLKIFIRKIRGGKVEVDIRSEFSPPETVDEKSTILTLELPDIGNI